jgi:hypothetical protein
MRIEAVSLRGKPVGFFVLGPWSKPWRTVGPEGSVFSSPVFVLQVVLLMTVLIGAPLLARMNLARGRGDRKGALRVAGFIFVVHMLLWACRSHVIASLGTFGMFLLAVCTSTFAAVVVWVTYLAIEPYLRRNWPGTLISWTSAISGRIGDAIVGRDILVGMLSAVVVQVLQHAVNSYLANGRPHLPSTETLLGLRSTLGMILQPLPYGVRNSILFLFLILLLRIVLRNRWAAAAAFTIILTALNVHMPDEHWLLDIGVSLSLNAIFAVVLLRWGLLAGAVSLWMTGLEIPVTSHTAAWYHAYAVSALVLLVAMAAWALHTSMKGRRLLPRGLFG